MLNEKCKKDVMCKFLGNSQSHRNSNIMVRIVKIKKKKLLYHKVNIYK